MSRLVFMLHTQDVLRLLSGSLIRLCLSFARGNRPQSTLVFLPSFMGIHTIGHVQVIYGIALLMALSSLQQFLLCLQPIDLGSECYDTR